MAQATQPYKRSLAGSVGAGMRSVFAGEGRRFYTLVHKVSSKYHKAGESQQIIVDQIEIGRGAQCQVRFDETFETVSRRHAAIVKDGDNWKLVQLSTTNSTYLNGHKVAKEWYLQNGDEIQLSTNGPKLGFIIPEGKKGLVSSINLTARLNLFRQQALRPYKQALTGLACLLLAVVGIGGYLFADTIKENRSLQTIVAETTKKWENEKTALQQTIAHLDSLNVGLINDAKTRDRKLKQLENRLEKEIIRPTHPHVSSDINNQAIEDCLPHVYYIQTAKFEIHLPSGETGFLDCSQDGVPRWSGTGFLLKDGRFVTARHVVEGWYFWQDGSGVNEQLAQLNYIVNNGGSVVAHFIAVSSSGKQMQFTSKQFNCDRSRDVSGTVEDGGQMSIAQLDETDYAYFQTSNHSGLNFDKGKSTKLERGTKLTVLGFPLGLGANAVNDINPIYGSGIVAAPGLQQGRILTTDTNYEQGNSGGPVFCTDEKGNLTVIGIVSAGAGRVTGFVVPISVIY